MDVAMAEFWPKYTKYIRFPKRLHYLYSQATTRLQNIYYFTMEYAHLPDYLYVWSLIKYTDEIHTSAD